MSVPCSLARPSGGRSRLAAQWRYREPPVGLVRLRLTRALLDVILRDLRRPHSIAAERVGFLSVATGQADGGELLALGMEYHAIPDDHYVADATVGARIGTEAIRGAIRRVLNSGRGLLHVHLHDHRGRPRFSGQDLLDQPLLVESLMRAAPAAPHGMLVLSENSAAAWIWRPGAAGPAVPAQITLIGYPMVLIPPGNERTASVNNERFARQSFLGPDAQAVLSRARIGVVGLGGGGSHVAQQLAHVGALRPRFFDGDNAEDTNLNRLVGARSQDVRAGTPKVEIAGRLYHGLLPDATPVFHGGRWQERPELLRGCDVVIGCVDTFAGRHELEVACRRYGMPYIDIGMDVHEIEGAPSRMAGQIILSMPGRPCMWCLQFLNEERLGREARRYGDAGGRPQVVWPNGVLASTAVGLAVDLLSGWTEQRDRTVYLTYDGNTAELRPHPRLDYLGQVPCSHYGLALTGDPVFRRVQSVRSTAARHVEPPAH